RTRRLEGTTMTSPIGAGYRWNDYASADDPESSSAGVCRESTSKTDAAVTGDEHEPMASSDSEGGSAASDSDHGSAMGQLERSGHERAQTEIVPFYHDAFRTPSIGSAEVGAAMLKGHDQRTGIDAEVFSIGAGVGASLMAQATGARV